MSRRLLSVDRPNFHVGDVVRLRHPSGYFVGFEVERIRPNWLKVRSLKHPTVRRRRGFIPIARVDSIERGKEVVWLRVVLVDNPAGRN